MVTPQEFSLKIAGLGHNPTSFARLMVALGAPGPDERILRNLTNYLNGTTKRIPDEMVVILNLLYHHPEDARLVKARRQGRPPASAKRLLTA